MEFATGAMSSLLPKLGELLLDEYNLKESVKKGIGDLKSELESMQGALEKVSSVPLDQLDPQVKIWANEARDLSYAIEDSLDSFVTRIQGGEPTKPTIKSLLKKAHNKCTKFKARHEIAGDIKDIESQVMKVKERYERYKINDIVANFAQTTVVADLGPTTIDPSLSTVYNKASELIGTDGIIDELMKFLSEDVETSQKNLKIVSIVGHGGLGKTTVAKALYENLSYTYKCTGFVRVGQNQGTKKVLRDILLELDMEFYKAASTMDERQLINQLQKFLTGKRYFIVIDDLSDIPTWETIKFAFVDSHPESRIIITTRIIDVATKAGGIYCMKPLSYDNSKMLFHTRTCGAEGVSQDNQCGEVTSKFIRKCGGVPLAIITIASLLVDKPRADWSKVYDAIGFGHEDSEVDQNTRKILSFSYYDLPSNLKTCLLYLSMFPKGYFIEKKTLIWRWVIEGFVCDKEGIGSYELGEIYFNKLVNRNLIRFKDHVSSTYFNMLVDTDRVGCRVHDMVIDFIRTISSDINFVTVDDMEQHVTYLQGKRTSRIQRLALHTRSGEHNTSIQMEHVRSFNASNCGVRKIPPLSSFEVLRVLVIEWFYFLDEDYSLEHVRKLVQLRYLGLVKTAVKLPEGIGHDLKFLEILDVRGGLITELPPSVGELNNLRCLWADKGTVMKGKIGELTRLEELQLYSVEECPNFFTELGKLKNLRVLKVQFNECEETACKAMAGSLCNLRKIQSLTIRWLEMDTEFNSYKWEFHVRVGSLEDLAPDSKLHFLSLTGIIIPRVPSWINSLQVPLLSHVWLYLEAVESQDVHTLGKFPSLFFLGLLSEEEKRISYAFGSDEFQHLGYLVTNIEITLGEGALPRLESLSYSASASAGREDSLVPWKKGQLPLLENAHCQLDCTNIVWKELKAAEEILGKADIYIVRERVNYDQFTYAIGFILDGLDRPDGDEITSDRRGIRRMVRSIETLLRDDDEPRVGMYGEQELRSIATRLKTWLHDNAAGNEQEELDNSDGTDEEYTNDYDEDVDDYGVDDQDDDHDDGGSDNDTEQEEADNDAATISQEGRATQP